MSPRWTEPTGRPATLSCRGMVATPHPLASYDGLAAMTQGGNAVDAAVAASATLAVTYPHMAGLGGDLFLLVRPAGERRPRALNASGCSARLATADWYGDRGHGTIPTRGALAALTVPGTVAGWATALQRFGRRGLDAALAPAVRHAREGFPVTRSLAAWLERDRTIVGADPQTRALFLPGGRCPAEGERLQLPALAATLEEISRQGWESFYRGALGERIARALERAGSPLRLDDFAEYRPEWVEPIRSTYRGREVCTLPPNSQGLALLQILNLVEGFDLAPLGDLAADYVHLLVAATRLAIEDRDRYAADPGPAAERLSTLLSKGYAAERRGRMQGPPPAPPRAAAGGDTVYLCAADEEGNVVSLIQSLYHDFGAAFTAGETGVLLQNRGCAFTLGAGEPTSLAPQRRPFHTLMPAMVLEDGEPSLALGTMGGEGQPQTLAAILTRILDFGCDLQRAVEAPRWLFGRTWGEPLAGLTMEAGFPEETLRRLRELGHEVRPVPAWSDVLGHAQAIGIDRGNGVFHGAADPRGDGAAIGF